MAQEDLQHYVQMRRFNTDMKAVYAIAAPFFKCIQLTPNQAKIRKALLYIAMTPIGGELLRQTKPNCFIRMEPLDTQGSFYSRTILLSQKRLKSTPKIACVLFHELRHLHQKQHGVLDLKNCNLNFHELFILHKMTEADAKIQTDIFTYQISQLYEKANLVHDFPETPYTALHYAPNAPSSCFSLLMDEMCCVNWQHYYNRYSIECADADHSFLRSLKSKYRSSFAKMCAYYLAAYPKLTVEQIRQFPDDRSCLLGRIRHLQESHKEDARYDQRFVRALALQNQKERG